MFKAQSKYGIWLILCQMPSSHYDAYPATSFVSHRRMITWGATKWKRQLEASKSNSLPMVSVSLCNSGKQNIYSDETPITFQHLGL